MNTTGTEALELQPGQVSLWGNYLDAFSAFPGPPAGRPGVYFPGQLRREGRCCSGCWDPPEMNCPSRSRSITYVSPSLLRNLKPGVGRTFSGPQRWKIADMGFRPVSFQGPDPPRKAVNCLFVPAPTKNLSQGFPALTPACPCIHSVALPGSLPLRLS